MTSSLVIRVRSAAALGALLLGACQAHPPAKTPVASDPTALLARIQAGIGDAPCSSDAQCRTLPIGEKPCGGPERWLAWSSASPQATQLPAWAAELSALVRQRNQESGILGNCRVQPDPGAICQAERCVLMAPLSAR